jgi:hypothetical protein
MNKPFFLVLVAGIFIGATVMSTIQVSESAIPPTRAWDDITVGYNTTVATSPETTLSAKSSSDNLVIISDGSILFNITSYP